MHKLHITIYYNFLTNKYGMDNVMSIETGEERIIMKKVYTTFEETFEISIYSVLKWI